MKFVLIVIWLSTTQSHHRNNIHWDEVAMQEFDSKASCESAKKFIADNTDRYMKKECVPK